MRSILKYFLIVVWMVIYSCNTIAPPKTPYVHFDESPAWSPDGKLIAYWYFDMDENDTYTTGLYFVDTTGQNIRLIVDCNACYPDWSPDSKLLVFNYGRDIYTISMESKELNPITNVGSALFPNFSPDGKKIAFDVTTGTVESVGIWIYSVDKKIKKHLGLGRDPDWHFSGERIVYFGPTGSTNTESQIWTADTSGNDILQLTFNNFTTNRYPAWSPDGEKIAWSITAPNIYYSDIWIMNSDGSDQRRVTTGGYPSWSPDSKKLVFMKSVPYQDKVFLWIIDLETNQIKQLTHER